MRKFIFFLVFIASCNFYSFSFSQQIIRSSLSCFGNAAFENGFTIQQTVGQPSNTQLFSNGKILLRQGFQQPIKSAVNYYTKQCVLNLSPNPTSDFVTISFSEEIGEFQISIFDIVGNLLFEDITTSSNYQFDVKKIPNGVYLVRVISKSGYNCNEKLIILL